MDEAQHEATGIGRVVGIIRNHLAGPCHQSHILLTNPQVRTVTSGLAKGELSKSLEPNYLESEAGELLCERVVADKRGRILGASNLGI